MFNVGDIVTGIPERTRGYAYTTHLASMEVIGIINEVLMNVRVLAHEQPEYVGATATVEQRHFVLTSPPAEREDLSVWVDKKGAGIPFKEMTTAHLTNVIAMLYRENGKRNAQRSKLVTLEKELLRRLKEQYEVPKP